MCIRRAPRLCRPDVGAEGARLLCRTNCVAIATGAEQLVCNCPDLQVGGIPIWVRVHVYIMTSDTQSTSSDEQFDKYSGAEIVNQIEVGDRIEGRGRTFYVFDRQVAEDSKVVEGGGVMWEARSRASDRRVEDNHYLTVMSAPGLRTGRRAQVSAGDSTGKFAGVSLDELTLIKE